MTTQNREITSHKVNGCNEALKIEVLDQPGSGGACHVYLITGFEATPKSLGMAAAFDHTLIAFQNGPIKEAGVNGLTQEALLAIVADRLLSFQAGPYACQDNADALEYVAKAITTLQKRTLARLARGVEGTHTI